MNSEEISKIHKTKSSVPPEPEVDHNFRGHLNMVAKQNVSNGFLVHENINSEEIVKIYQTQSPVPLSTC